MTEECLSIVELLELRASAGAERVDAQRHVRECARCAGLLRALPDVPSGEAPSDLPDLRAHPVTVDDTVEDVRAGQIWQIRAPDLPDRLYVAVVLGRRRDVREAVVVAPTSDDVHQATDLDVLIDDSVLGYRFLVSVWHFGTVLADQLDKCLGSLPEADLSAVRSVYGLVVTGESPTVPVPVGVGTAGSEDERLVWRAEQMDSLRPLWRPWRQRLAEHDSEPPIGETEGGEREPTLSVLLRLLFDTEEWDLVSLAETAHISTAHIESLFADRLDLTDQTDADSVAAIIHALQLDFDEVQPHLRRSLESSPGGLRVGVAGTDRIAARTLADVSEERRRKELWEGLASVDDSDGGRRRAIESYLQTVEAALEELGRR